MRHWLVCLALFIISSCLNSTDWEKVDQICSQVNNDNWRLSTWKDSVSSQDICRSNGAFFLAETKRMPCTFGGFPFLCELDPPEAEG